MKPNIMSSYKADHTTPWKYLWIGFDGNYAKKLLSQIGLSSRTLTFSANCGDKLLEVINRMLECDADGISYHLYLQTQLYVFSIICLKSYPRNQTNFILDSKITIFEWQKNLSKSTMRKIYTYKTLPIMLAFVEVI